MIISKIQKSFLIFIGLSFISYLSFSQNPAEDFAGGTGTSTDPYKITNAIQLSNIRNYLGESNINLHFKIMNDIDLSGDNWLPIANPPEAAFHGKLNGGGNKIVGLNIGQGSNTAYRYSGLFGMVKTGAKIDSVYLVGGNINVFTTNASYTGSIAGYIDQRALVGDNPNIVTISNCHSSVNIQSNSTLATEIGGIVGRALTIGDFDISLDFDKCSYSGNISAKNDAKIGGILGYNASYNSGIIEVNFISCSNSGNLSANEATNVVGGILGSTFNENTVTTVFEKCYNTGDLSVGSGDSYVSGIIGYGGIHGGVVLNMSNCYSYAVLNSTGYCIGGLVSGLQVSDGAIVSIENCYSAGIIKGSALYAGGIIGKVGSTSAQYTVKNCIAAQTYIECTNIEPAINRIVGENSSAILINNYAFSGMKLNEELVSSSNENSSEGLDKSFKDFFKLNTYNAENLNWNISDDGTLIWNIFNNNSFPYFPRQSAPVYVSELYRDNLIIELKNDSDSLKLFKYIDDSHIITYQDLNSGNDDINVDLLNMNAEDIILLVNYEYNKEPSYKTWVNIQKRNIIVTAENKSKCFDTEDGALTYSVSPNLPDEENLTGELTRQSGDDAGNYYILQGTLNNSNNGNYNIIYVRGTFTIYKVDNSVTLDNYTLTANANSATYQWLDCSNNYAVIADATEQSFSPILNGNYAVEITQNGCVDTSECFQINNVTVCNCIVNREITLHPNPTNEVFYISFHERIDDIYGDTKIEILSIDGKLLHSSEYNNQQVIELSLKEYPGLYFVVVTNMKDNCKEIFKLIKN